MTKKLFMLVALVMALAGGTATAQTSQASKGNVFAMNDAREYGQWTMTTTGSVSTGSQTVTINGDGFITTTLGARTVYPLGTTHPVLFDPNGANPETLVPSAVSCTSNGLQSTCTVTATFVYAHTGPFMLRSGTYGVCEAAGDLPSAGGTVVVNAGYGGSTSTLTTATTGAGACGSSTINILDVRAGAFQFYTYDGANSYAASQSVINSTTTPNADVTAANGSGYFYTGGRSNATNYSLTAVATGANTAAVKLGGLKTRSTSATGDANTTITTGDDLLSIDAFGADGTDYIGTASILFDSTGTIGTTRVPSVIKFLTGTDAAPTVKTLALTLNADQSATFAAGLTTTNVTDSALTSGRVIIASTGGLLANDSDFTFATDTATITKIIGSTNISTPSLFNTAGALALSTVTSGNITLAPAAAATAAVTVSTRFEQAKGATIVSGSCSSGDCTAGGDGNFFLLSGTTAVDGFATAGWQAGSVIYLTFDGNLTLNNAGTVAGGFADMRLVGAANVSATALDIVTLMYDGTSWMQTAPTLVK